MPYLTGTVASATALRSIVEQAGIDAGYTLASGVLSKGDSHIKLTAPSTNELRIESARDAAFTLPAPGFARIADDGWPATYHLFRFANPDMVMVVLVAAGTRHQHLGFGVIGEKVGAWTGGEWFSASKSGVAYNAAGLVSIPIILKGEFFSTIVGDGTLFSGEPVPFWASLTPGPAMSGSYLFANITGKQSGWSTAIITPSSDGIATGGFTHFVQATPGFLPLLQRQPNAWNAEPVLLPWNLNMLRDQAKVSRLGALSHLRALRIDNLGSGDIITLGLDRWMVFPASRKNSVDRDGWVGGTAAATQSTAHTGTFGWAIRYDGP